MVLRIFSKIWPLIIFGLLASTALSHGPDKHENGLVQDKGAAPDTKTLKAKVDRINALYVERVKPIFQKKCFDCHTDKTRYPWYYNLPGAKQIMAHDVIEGKRHLEMSRDYPFGGHGSPREDLEAIDKVAKDKSMPPLRYKVLHWGSGLSKEEEAAITKWVSESIEILDSPL